MEDELYCSNCGNKLDENSVFCNKCGQKIKQDTETENSAKCPYCQSNISKKALKCPNCGEWVDESQKLKHKKNNFKDLFNKYVTSFNSNKKAVLCSKIIIYITFIYAVINRLLYSWFNSIIREYFVYESHSNSVGFYVNSYYTFSQTHDMDGLTQLIYNIGTVLYGNLTGSYKYSLSRGITAITDKIWLVLFLVSLVASILFIAHKRDKKSVFYLIITIISFLLMNYLLWYYGVVHFRII